MSPSCKVCGKEYKTESKAFKDHEAKCLSSIADLENKEIVEKVVENKEYTEADKLEFAKASVLLFRPFTLKKSEALAIETKNAMLKFKIEIEKWMHFSLSPQYTTKIAEILLSHASKDFIDKYSKNGKDAKAKRKELARLQDQLAKLATNLKCEISQIAEIGKMRESLTTQKAELQNLAKTNNIEIPTEHLEASIQGLESTHKKVAKQIQGFENQQIELESQINDCKAEIENVEAGGILKKSIPIWMNTLIANPKLITKEISNEFKVAYNLLNTKPIKAKN